MNNNWRTFPKIELHRHLEGSFHLPTLYSLAQRNDIDAPNPYDDFCRSVQFPADAEPDFLSFLGKFRNDWYRSLDDVSELAYQSIYNFRNDGIFFIELRFSPEHFALQNNFDRKETTLRVIEAGNQAAEDAGFSIAYLITFNRSKQEEPEMINLYKTIRDLDIPEIVGIDLAGDEMNYPPEMFERFFSIIKADGLYKTCIHAGEVTGPEQIWTAIETLHADRIGHGTSSISDPALQHRLEESNIILEQCITSNYQTGSWADEKNHPIARLYHAGVPVTINSDDPTIQSTDLSDDYTKASEFFGFTSEDFRNLNITALEGSFISEEQKADLRREYETALQDWESQFLS
ncbi:MAG: adenosine deaminase [Spirochaetales bacterium]|nr:adenosine deaminase [Spirochaetales bacterium]MCF7939768.1 adenosine deaminase [Spirochaetales bacterium]